MLKDILAIRSYREARAQAAVREQQSVLVRASGIRQAAEEQLTAFRAMAAERESQWVQELCSKPVRLREITEVNSAIGELRARTLHLHQLLDKAEQARVQASEVLAERKAQHASAWRLEQKFAELVREESTRQTQQMEQKEEAEMNEAAERIGRRPALEDLPEALDG